jgi:tRNA nucleotidyltransferase (CCA-adding enzyme)
MDFIEDINANGGMVYLVGGAIRDKLVNKFHGYEIQTKDYDLLITGMDIITLEKILHKYGKLKQAGKAFGIIIFNSGDSRFRDIDIALPRKEVSTGPGYKDFDIVTDYTISLEEDLSRRDATINSLAYKLKNINDMTCDSDKINISDIIDYYGGVSDIKNKIWKAVGDPKKRFIEDPTRILRCLRQTTNLGLTIDKTTIESLIQNCDLLKNIISTSVVRLTNEVVKTINGRYIDDWIRFILTKRIGSLLGLNYTKEEILNVCSAFDYAVKKGFTLEIKMAILLNPLKSKAISWTHDFELSATVYKKENIPIIEAMTRHYDDLQYIYDLIDIKNNEANIYLRKWIVNVNSYNEGKSIIPIAEYLLCVFESYKCHKIDKLKKMYEINKDIIINVKYIKLSGKFLLDMGFSGVETGKIKQDIFNKIIMDELLNNEEDIIQYVKKTYITH